jgi:hypothetical protein
MATTALAPPTTERANRTEPSPLAFLRRSAHVFPDEVAAVLRASPEITFRVSP